MTTRSLQIFGFLSVEVLYPRVDKLWPMDRIQPASCCYSFIRTQPHLVIYVSSVTDLSSCDRDRTATKPNMLTV